MGGLGEIQEGTPVSKEGGKKKEDCNHIKQSWVA